MDWWVGWHMHVHAHSCAQMHSMSVCHFLAMRFRTKEQTNMLPPPQSSRHLCGMRKGGRERTGVMLLQQSIGHRSAIRPTDALFGFSPSSFGSKSSANRDRKNFRRQATKLVLQFTLFVQLVRREQFVSSARLSFHQHLPHAEGR